MSAALKVPTIFTAVDKFSSVVGGMTGAVGKFANSTEASIAKAQGMLSGVPDLFCQCQKTVITDCLSR